MRTLVLLVGLLVVAQITSAQTFALPNTFCQYQYQTPGHNAFTCNDMAFTYNGTNYYLNFATNPVAADGTLSGPNIVYFQDRSTYQYIYVTASGTEIWTGTPCTQGPAPYYKPCSSYATITVNFSGAFTGTLVFDYTLHAALSRYWHFYGLQTDGALTID